MRVVSATPSLVCFPSGLASFIWIIAGIALANEVCFAVHCQSVVSVCERRSLSCVPELPGWRPPIVSVWFLSVGGLSSLFVPDFAATRLVQAIAGICFRNLTLESSPRVNGSARQHRFWCSYTMQYASLSPPFAVVLTVPQKVQSSTSVAVRLTFFVHSLSGVGKA